MCSFFRASSVHSKCIIATQGSINTITMFAHSNIHKYTYILSNFFSRMQCGFSTVCVTSVASVFSFRIKHYEEILLVFF